MNAYIVLSRTRYPDYLFKLLGTLGVAVMVFILGFSIRAETWGLSRSGLDMAILALGTCMVIAAASGTQWRSPRAISPLLKVGQRSYEIYLTHMFVVFALFRLFVAAGKPLRAVPILFVAVILIAGLLGELVARFYSDPLNRFLREHWGEGRNMLGAIVEAENTA